MFGKQSKYELCPNCIEAEKFSYDEASRHQMRKEFGIDENDVVIGHIGRFAPVKNHPFILKIFEKIVLIENNTKLCLCGVGADKDKIISIVNANETIKNNVVFLPVGDVSKYYSLFDVFILPSYHEGFPLSLLESQASGCLSFASDTITREVQLSDLVEYIKIDDEQKWIDNITSSFCRLKNIERKKYNLVIKESPYDVDCATCFLVSYYERVLKEHLKS